MVRDSQFDSFLNESDFNLGSILAQKARDDFVELLIERVADAQRFVRGQNNAQRRKASGALDEDRDHKQALAVERDDPAL